MILARKLLRELRAQRGQVLAVMAVTALGILMFVATLAGYEDLQQSYADTRHRLHLADVQVDVSTVSAAELARLGAIAGVARVDARVQASLPVIVPRARLLGGERARLRIEGRVLSIPDGRQPPLDALLLQEGRLPAGPDEVLVEKHLADHHGLGPGGELDVEAPGVSRRLTVVGVAVSAEYLFVARDGGDLIPSPTEFGVLWMGRDGLRSLARALLAGSAAPAGDAAAPMLAAFAVAASDAPGNQILVGLDGGARAADVIDRMRAVLGPARALEAVLQQDLPGVKLLQMDVDGFKGMAGFFPLFFLGVASFIVTAILSRMVDAQRPIIGTMLALGVPQRRVLRHYLAFSLALVGAGALLGAIGGHFAGAAMTRAYAVELGIPYVTVRPHLGLALAGLGAGLLVALLAGWAPARRAAALSPSEAMRAAAPPSGAFLRLSRRLPASLPLGVRWVLRDLLRRPGRNLATAAGVAASLVLVLTSGAVFDSIRALTSTLFDDANRYDLRVDLLAPRPQADLEAGVRGVPGIARAETLLGLPLDVAGAKGRHAALLEALPAGSQLIRAVGAGGRELGLGEGGVVLSRSLAGEIGARVGESVELRLLPAGARMRARVDGLTDAALGSTAILRLADAQRGLGLDGLVNAAVVTVQPGARLAVRGALEALPGAARVHDLGDVREAIGQMMGLGWAMMAMMLAFSVVLAAAILFNTATLSILERARELATMRALGSRMRDLAAAIALENGAVALLGLALGWPVSLLSIRALLALYQSDMFSLPFVLSPVTVALALAGVAGVLLLAQWPGLREIARANLAEAVRTREG